MKHVDVVVENLPNGEFALQVHIDGKLVLNENFDTFDTVEKDNQLVFTLLQVDKKGVANEAV